MMGHTQSVSSQTEDRPSSTSGSSCRHYEVLRNAPHASTSGVGKARDRLTRPLTLEDNAPSPPPPKYRPNTVRQVMELDDVDEADNDYIPKECDVDRALFHTDPQPERKQQRPTRAACTDLSFHPRMISTPSG